MTVTAVASEEQFKQIINRDRPVIIDFWATWCGPCRAIGPIYEGLSKDPSTAAIEFYKVDVDAQRDIAEAAGVRAMPVFIVYRNGQKVEELMGAHPSRLAALVDKYK